MSMGCNMVSLFGGLTQDPVIKVGNKASWLRFSVACGYRAKGANGEWEDRTDFVPCKAFGRLAENVSAYCHKGSRVMVVGKVRTDSWQGQDGDKKYDTYVLAEEVFFGDGARGGSTDYDAGDRGGYNDRTRRNSGGGRSGGWSRDDYYGDDDAGLNF